MHARMYCLGYFFFSLKKEKIILVVGLGVGNMNFKERARQAFRDGGGRYDVKFFCYSGEASLIQGFRETITGEHTFQVLDDETYRSLSIGLGFMSETYSQRLTQLADGSSKPSSAPPGILYLYVMFHIVQDGVDFYNVVGYAELLKKTRELIFIDFISTSPNYKYVGTNLMAMILNASKNAGFSFCMLMSVESAFDFYMKYGFVFLGRTRGGFHYLLYPLPNPLPLVNWTQVINRSTHPREPAENRSIENIERFVQPYETNNTLPNNYNAILNHVRRALPHARTKRTNQNGNWKFLNKHTIRAHSSKKRRGSKSRRRTVHDELD
jgi:ribosomal protein S18 acetylase RimI-like enzyme